jgi:hypothetical protein
MLFDEDRNGTVSCRRRGECRSIYQAAARPDGAVSSGPMGFHLIISRLTFVLQIVVKPTTTGLTTIRPLF